MRTRRSGFILAGAATFGSIGAIRAAARAAQFVYKLGNPNPVDFPASVRLVQMANAIKAETNGQMEIQIFANAILGSVQSMIGQLRIGSIQFLNSGNSTFSGIIPASATDSVGFVFRSERQAHAALDGPLGAYIRREFALKGVYVFEKGFNFGFRQTTSSTKPIRTADDLNGFKIRVSSVIVVDLFKTLGASAIPLNGDELYTALETHVVDGQETPLSIVESYRLYEVQKYLSITNHIMTGGWLVANGDAWNALPPQIKAVVNRNAAKYALLERDDMYALNASLADKLKRQGLTSNTADTATMRARLRPYYMRWKNELGSTAWGLLEASVGPLIS